MVFLFTTVLLPLVVITLLWRRPRRPFRAWMTTLLMAAGVCGFSVFVAPWAFLGVWIRYLIAALFLAAVARSLFRTDDDPERAPETAVRSLVKVAIGFFFGGVAVNAVLSRIPPSRAIDLAFPLRGGAFVMVHGGSRSATNVHHAHPAQRYALDIAKLGPLMRRARGFHPDALEQYAIWRSPVYAPCNGQVIAAVDGLPEQQPGSMDPKNAPGNHVVVRCGDADVWLAHFRKGSVLVKTGEHVATGAKLGEVGNSGNTTEPHLHVHVERAGQGVPATFDGRWLVRNDVITK